MKLRKKVTSINFQRRRSYSDRRRLYSLGAASVRSIPEGVGIDSRVQRSRVSDGVCHIE